MQFTRLGDHICELGESPLWDERRQLLFFVDIHAPAIHAIRIDGGGFRTWIMPAVTGSIGLTESGRLIVALKHELALFCPDSIALTPFAKLPADEPADTRLNDGKVGPDGAFWVGTMHDVEDRQPVGALYRVAPDASVTRRIAGLRVSNGLAWSPDGRVMVHSDTRGFRLDRWNFDPATGEISACRRLHNFDGSIGLPDGGAMDADGMYWSAGIYGGRLNRFGLDGAVLGSEAFPVPAPTMPCFCGPDLRMLAVTSLRVGGAAPLVADHPELGGLFIAQAPVAGSPVPRMKV